MDKLLMHIRKVIGDRKATEVGEIICDGIKDVKEISKEAKEEIEKYVNVTLLCFNDCQLESLENLPLLSLIEEIQLCDNKLSGKEIERLKVYKHLTIVKLCNNGLLKEIGDLKVFEMMKEIIYLDLRNCPVTKCEGYREKMFEMITHLKHLDMIDREGNNCSEIDVKSIEERKEDDDDDEFNESHDEDSEEGKKEANDDSEESNEDSNDNDDNSSNKDNSLNKVIKKPKEK